MSDIFLSYAREDAARAEQMAHALESQGWSVWWDRRIPHGQDFTTYIQRQLDAAGCVVVLWSNSSIASQFVRDEATEGLNGRLLPALIERVRPPLGFRALQSADLTDWRGTADHHEFVRFVESIAAIVPGRTKAPSRIEPIAVRMKAPAPPIQPPLPPPPAAASPVSIPVPRPVVEDEPAEASAPVSLALLVVLVGCAAGLANVVQRGLFVRQAEAYGLPRALISAQLFAHTVAFVAGACLGGLVGDRIGRGRVVLGGLAGLALSMLASLAAAGDAPSMFVMATASGITAGALLPNLIALGTAGGPARLQIWTTAAIFVGQSVAGRAADALLVGVDARVPVAIVGVVVLGLVGLLWKTLRPLSRTGTSARGGFAPLAVTAALGAAGLLSAVVMNVFARRPSTFDTAFGLGGLALALVGAAVATRWGCRPVLMTAAGATALAAIAGMQAPEYFIMAAVPLIVLRVLLPALAVRCYDASVLASGLGVVLALRQGAAISDSVAFEVWNAGESAIGVAVAIAMTVTLVLFVFVREPRPTDSGGHT